MNENNYFKERDFKNKVKIGELLTTLPSFCSDFIVGIENNENNIWGLLLGTGYLKVTEVVEMVFAFKGKDVKIEIFWAKGI